MQLGVEQHGEVFAECPYDGCDGSMQDFWFWDKFRVNYGEKLQLPEVPAKDTVYPLYPDG